MKLVYSAEQDLARAVQEITDPVTGLTLVDTEETPSLDDVNYEPIPKELDNTANAALVGHQIRRLEFLIELDESEISEDEREELAVATELGRGLKKGEVPKDMRQFYLPDVKNYITILEQREKFYHTWAEFLRIGRENGVFRPSAASTSDVS